MIDGFFLCKGTPSTQPPPSTNSSVHFNKEGRHFALNIK